MFRNIGLATRYIHTGRISLQYTTQQSRSSIPIDSWLKNSNKRVNQKQSENNINTRHKNNGYQKNRKKTMAVNWSTGTERAKEAANSVLSKIFEVNQRGNIKYLKDGKVQETNIRTFAKGIDLEKQGLNIVSIVNSDKDGDQLPFVKIVDSMTALKKYSDHLAEKKVNELKKMGLMPKKFMDKEKQSSEDHSKQIKVSWNIKEDDLLKQKAHDISSMLKKGYKVNLYLADKDEINSRNWIENFENVNSTTTQYTKKIKESEKNRRELIVTKLKEISEEHALEPIIEGTILSKMVIKLTPRPSAGSNDKRALKEERKRLRMEKLQKRIEKKKGRLNL
ncbi:Aim23p [Nakaseomyces bracarensis]|uniref:Aim23p n=1 Tax=Nakaseomyces bracarensis TaxID=273131 RepID=UPI0038727E78